MLIKILVLFLIFLNMVLLLNKGSIKRTVVLSMFFCINIPVLLLYFWSLGLYFIPTVTFIAIILVCFCFLLVSPIEVNFLLLFILLFLVLASLLLQIDLFTEIISQVFYLLLVTYIGRRFLDV